ncbi:hypothetical protein ACIQZB_28370 [Streptomyces sp. NPDC097727]
MSLALALMGTAFLTYIAVSSPTLIAPIGLGLAAFMALHTFLKL